MLDVTAPFRGSLAVAAGLVTKGQLRGSRFRRLFPDIYLPADVTPTLAIRSRGAYLLVVGRGALAGYSAAELLGARIAPVTPTPKWLPVVTFVSAEGCEYTGSSLRMTRS